MFYGIAAASMLACLGLSAFSLYHKLVTGNAIPGWTSTTIVVSLFGAMNALGIGVLGEYAIRIFDQVRARPNYIVARISSQTESAPEVLEPEIKVRDEAAELLNWLAEHRATKRTQEPAGIATQVD
jgi:dolichol-phosphate mannosyltransferase